MRTAPSADELIDTLDTIEQRLRGDTERDGSDLERWERAWLDLLDEYRNLIQKLEG